MRHSLNCTRDRHSIILYYCTRDDVFLKTRCVFCFPTVPEEEGPKTDGGHGQRDGGQPAADGRHRRRGVHLAGRHADGADDGDGRRRIVFVVVGVRVRVRVVVRVVVGPAHQHLVGGRLQQGRRLVVQQQQVAVRGRGARVLRLRQLCAEGVARAARQDRRRPAAPTAVHAVDEPRAASAHRVQRYDNTILHIIIYLLRRTIRNTINRRVADIGFSRRLVVYDHVRDSWLL